MGNRFFFRTKESAVVNACTDHFFSYPTFHFNANHLLVLFAQALMFKLFSFSGLASFGANSVFCESKVFLSFAENTQMLNNS
jgi:hypothetical protein